MSKARTLVRDGAPWAGLLAAVALVAAALLVPILTDWHVYSRAPRSASSHDLPPLHGLWDPKWFGPGTVPTVLIAALGWRYAAEVAARLPWRWLLAASYAVGLAWLLSLALVDGSAGISRVLGNPFDYLGSARDVPSGWSGVHGLITGYIDRIPLHAPDNWPTSPAGHPPGMLLFFVGLVRIGLGGDLQAGLVVTAVAATIPLAVLTTLRALRAEATARTAAPFLVLTPSAVFLAVSADAVISAVVAWGLACLAIGATHPARRGRLGWSTLSGLLLGASVFLSYGMPLIGLLALAVLAAARSWRPLPVAVIAAIAVVIVVALLGFSWWDAYPVLRRRYYDGVARLRPFWYWSWADFACLLLSGGPLLGAGVVNAVRQVSTGGLRRERTTLLLVMSVIVVVVAADLSAMSKAETERIWLPFVPWLTLSVVLLPPRWRTWGMGLQLGTAIAVQQLCYTVW